MAVPCCPHGTALGRCYVIDRPHSQARERLLSFLQHLRNWEIRIAALALLAMMLVICADVFMRYVFNSPIRGSYDFVESMLVVTVFHGIAAGFLARTNIVIDLFDLFAPRKVIVPCIRISDLISVVALVVLTSAMITPFTQAWQYGDTKIDLGLPLWVLWVVALGGMLFSIVCALGAAFLVKPVPNEGPAA
jgi:TRAP-type transport system small permease protein